MALTPKLELRQSQSLIMTPQLQQAIKLLQLSNIELGEFVADQIEKNPLLEVDDRESASAERRDNQKSDSDSTQGSDPGTETSSLTETDTLMSGDSTDLDASGTLDTEYENLYTEESKAELQNKAIEDSQSAASMDWSNVGSSSGSFDPMESNLEATLSETKTLREHLTEQLTVSVSDPTERLIGIDLIDCIDEAGYLASPLENVANRLGAPCEQVETVLAKLQKFEPAGIFARDLSECLAIQLKERNRFDPAMEALVANLDYLAKRDLDALKKSCGVDAEDLADMIQEIRELDPKPGLAFNSEITQPVVPDVFVRPSSDGGWKVELNSDTLPKVLLNQRYYMEVNESAASKDAKAYIAECYNNANWLVKSLDQRAKTILKVSAELVKQQDLFLVKGVQHLRPLNLKTIAEAISMHESTVSRVTANKYMSTPRGLFELKYFFTSAIASSTGGEAHSAEAVRHRIRELIDAESPTSVLSDDRIVEILKDSGIDIARRTVAQISRSNEDPLISTKAAP